MYHPLDIFDHELWFFPNRVDFRENFIYFWRNVLSNSYE